MGVCVVLYEDAPTGPHPNSARRKRRETRTEIRNRTRSPAVDSLDDEEELARFLSDADQHGQPTLSRWAPFGRSWYLAPDEVEPVVVEVARALLAAEPGSDEAAMLVQFLGLARRAVAERLSVLVLPDQEHAPRSRGEVAPGQVWRSHVPLPNLSSEESASTSRPG